ncbi:MAG: acetolactate synthase large subunit [Actinomycetaceae bacterium]|nr:acetolactate synthase large subunit [Actinomycetaceae bacterium]
MANDHRKTPKPPSGSGLRAAPSAPVRMTGAQAIVLTLEKLGVTDLFGMPGGTILPTYDPLMSGSLNHILVRHEQGAAHAAEGYAKSTGKVGVCMATSGPGAINLLTGLMDSLMDSVPVLAITGQVGTKSIGTDAFQEADVLGASMPLTKHNFLVTQAEDIPARIAEAYHIASTGRPGPVLVDISKSAQEAEMDFSWPPTLDLPGYKIPGRPHPRQIKQAAQAITASQQPVLYVGGGAITSQSEKELLVLAELTGAPVVTTLTALGAFPASHKQNLGMPGMHGTVPAVGALQRADLLITLGARFDDRVTGKIADFAPGAKVIHVDIDAAEISKNRVADVPIVGDLTQAIKAMNEALPAAYEHYGKPDLSDWWTWLDRLQAEYPLGWDSMEDGLMAPQEVIEALGRTNSDDTIFVTGVGQHQMWAAQFIKYEKPRTYLSSCGLGTMGFGVPAAMGAQVANPNTPVWLIDGDGCFQMTNQELATCVVNKIPIKIAIINNSSLGMVRQWQTLFYGQRYSNTDLFTGAGTQRIPDFVKMAEAYGCKGIRVEKSEDIEAAIREANEVTDRPVIIDFVVSPDAMVWPMVAAGTSNDQIMYARGLAPEWEKDA